MCDLCLKYGDYPNNRKSCVLVTPDLYAQAMEVFANADVEIVSDGVLYLGSAIGSEAFISETLSQKVQSWVSEVTTLSIIAESEPHAAFAGFAHGASWNYFARVTNITSLSLSSDPLLPLETVICNDIIPQLTGFCHLSDIIHKLLSLPFQFVSLNITYRCTHLLSHMSNLFSSS